MKRIIKLLNNKRTRYLIVSTILILLCLALNIAFSSFTQTTSNAAANITVKDMTYSFTLNGTAGTIITAKANDLTKTDIIMTAVNNVSSKYELIYSVCSDSSCSSTLAKPAGLTIAYSTRTTDGISGSITNTGSKSIRLVITNTTSTVYYIKLGVNAGYSHNSLTLKNLIATSYNEDDLTILAYIDGTLSSTLPTIADYTASVTCELDGGGTSNATGTSTWNGTKWVINISGVDTGRTICKVKYTTNAIYEFAYTGAVQTVTLSAGIYKLEVWGAEGGDRSTGNPGKGGYSVGVLSLSNSTTLNVYVGGTGLSSGVLGSSVSGGFNGGGSSHLGTCTSHSNGRYANSGGGATDFRLSSSLYSRIIIAGGGGGAKDSGVGTNNNYGGGLVAGGATSRNGAGGTSTSGGAVATDDYTSEGVTIATSGQFGLGGDQTSGQHGGGGGGGGWYGGGAGKCDGAGAVVLVMYILHLQHQIIHQVVY